MNWDILLVVVKGLFAGLIASLVGYVKSLPEDKPFDWKKAGPTLIIGLVAGGVAAAFGLQLNDAYTLLAAYGVVSMVNSLWTWLIKDRQSRIARHAMKPYKRK